MRKTRVDELPQFWSIIKGDMSLVGPRPERFVLTEEFSQKWTDFPKRLRIIPGLTGYAQTHGGYDLKPNEKSKLDNYYVLTNNSVDDLKNAVRDDVEIDINKKNNIDFVLF